MASSEPIQPLRIQKHAAQPSPDGMSSPSGGRPLSEVSPMERRRNSPSFDQFTKKMLNGDSSPFDCSPQGPLVSPRLFWQERDPRSPARSSRENRNPVDDRDASPSLSKRQSIENLKRASRVKNSNMFAREHKTDYDPTRVPLIERPLAYGRPLNNTSLNRCLPPGIGTHDAREASPFNTKDLRLGRIDEPRPSSRDQPSPFKSSLSKHSRFASVVPNSDFDPRHGIWSESEETLTGSGRSGHRYAKSVTFDAAPPEINEYEQTTPAPSSIASDSREGSINSMDDDEYDDEDEEDVIFDPEESFDKDDSFDASLEDTEKTPVVLPDDWQYMGPDNANDELTDDEDNIYEENSSSSSITVQDSNRPAPLRPDSAASNGERRPLPPVPGINLPRARSDSLNSLTAATDHMKLREPSPLDLSPISKDELKEAQREQRERRMRRAGARDRSIERERESVGSVKTIEDEEDHHEDEAVEPRPRISRESILRKVKSQNQYIDDFPSSPERYDGHEYDGNEYGDEEYDPDLPLPSIENDSEFEDDDDDDNGSVIIKRERADGNGKGDLYSIPDFYDQQRQQAAVLEKNLTHASMHSEDSDVPDDDDESHYSRQSSSELEENPEPETISNDDELSSGQLTPRPASAFDRRPSEINMHAELQAESLGRMSLPEISEIRGDHGHHGLHTPKPAAEVSTDKSVPEITEKIEAIRASLQKSLARNDSDRPETPEEAEDEDEPGTPDSVIRRSPIPEEPEEEEEEDQMSQLDAPIIPERKATIKAPGSDLKTRASLTPADTETMAATRRKVSGERPPAVPPIPEKHRKRMSIGQASQSDDDDPFEDSEISNNDGSISDDPLKRKCSLVHLDIPISSDDEDLGSGLDKEFDRLMQVQKVAFDSSPIRMDQHKSCSFIGSSGAEYIGVPSFRPISTLDANKGTSQQRGYLMRQNTKVVVASSSRTDSNDASVDLAEPPVRGTKSAGNSPRKASQSTWTTEPWNGTTRRRSVRQASASRKKRLSGPAPPLPGQPSNVSGALGSVGENETTEADEFADGEERGRLFVKVIGVKELDLPLPKRERSYFALTLDNGLHCVTTSWLELNQNAPIGQEFELVVLEDLEFQLTLQTKLDPPKAPRMPVHSPPKPPKVPKQSTWGKVFSSPRKRKEMELRYQLEKQEAARKAANAQRHTEPTAWDLLHYLVAKDGSFARAYVSLKDHEDRAYGRPYTVDVPCFNEWATDDSQPSSVKSKRSTNGPQRLPPYKIGKLELQLLFVPKPKNAKDEDMPKSMNGCIRELKEAENVSVKTFEGYLSQQGGDCPYWRRRYFKLAGSKLTAYHETTHQPRATINLAKVVRIIDDRTSLIQKETSARGGGRRKSAFAEEEEGYMFVEEGFRIRFANGETIDFYADNAHQKEEWMQALGETIGKDQKQAKVWTDLVLSREKTLMARASQPGRGGRQSLGIPMKNPAAPAPRNNVHQHQASVPDNEFRSKEHAVRPKSMMF